MKAIPGMVREFSPVGSSDYENHPSNQCFEHQIQSANVDSNLMSDGLGVSEIRAAGFLLWELAYPSDCSMPLVSKLRTTPPIATCLTKS